jgi:hypothetical protein
MGRGAGRNEQEMFRLQDSLALIPIVSNGTQDSYSHLEDVTTSWVNFSFIFSNTTQCHIILRVGIHTYSPGGWELPGIWNMLSYY